MDLYRRYNDIMENMVKRRLSILFYQHGLIVSHYPKTFVVVIIFILLLCTSPILLWSFFVHETLSPRYWTSNSEYLGVGNSSSGSYTIPSYYQCIIDPTPCYDLPPFWYYGPPVVTIQQIVVSFSTHKQPVGDNLRKVQRISEYLLKTIDEAFKELNSTNFDICFKVKSSFLDLKKYEEAKCLILTPLPVVHNIFHELSENKFENYVPLEFSNELHPHQHIPLTTMKELLFGGFWTHWSTLLSMARQTDHVTFAITILLNTSSEHIQTQQEHFLKAIHKNLASNLNDYEWLHIFYPKSEDVVELLPMAFLYFVVFLYISISVSKIEEVKSRLGLSIAAVMTLFGSVSISVGLCIMFGLQASLDGRDVVPFIIIVIGIENILVMTKAVIATPRELDVPLRIAKGLGGEAVSISRSLLTEAILLTVAYLTFNPAIQEFCIIAMVGLLSDFILNIFFFVPILSIDLKRLELSDLAKLNKQKLLKTESKSKSLFSSIKELFIKLLTHKLVEARILRFLFKLVILLFLIWWIITNRATVFSLMKEWGFEEPNDLSNLFYTNSLVDDNLETTTTTNNIQHPYKVMFDSEFSGSQPYAFTLHPSNGSNVPLCGANVCWIDLVKYCIPRLLSYHSMGVTGQYVTLLAPIYLNAIGNNEHITPLPNGHIGYAQPHKFGLDLLFLIIAVLGTSSIMFALCNHLLFVLTIREGMPANSELVNTANISYQILGLLYAGHDILQPLHKIIASGNNMVSNLVRGDILVWNITPKRNSFSLNHHKVIELSCEIPQSTNSRQSFFTTDSEQTDSSTENRSNNPINDIPFNMFSPNIEHTLSEEFMCKIPKKRIKFAKNSVSCLDCNCNFIVAGFENGLLVVWDIESCKKVLEVKEFDRTLTAIQIIHSPYNQIVCGTMTGYLLKVPLNSGNSSCTKIKISDKRISFIQFAHNRLLISDSSQALRIFRMEMMEIFSLMRHSGSITCITVDNSPILGCLTGCSQGIVCSWDLETGTCVKNFKETTSKITEIVSTMTMIISLSEDGYFRVRERISGKLLQEVNPKYSARTLCLLTENFLAVGCNGCVMLYHLNYDKLMPKKIDIKDKIGIYDSVKKIKKFTHSVFAACMDKEIYICSWTISDKEKSD